LWLFEAVRAPGTTKLIAIAIRPAKTVTGALGTLDASDQFRYVREVLFQSRAFPLLSHIAIFFVVIFFATESGFLSNTFDGSLTADSFHYNRMSALLYCFHERRLLSLVTFL
jgi:hypothetical protein